MNNSLLVALLGLTLAAAQVPPGSSPPRPPRRSNGLVPDQQRPPGDPVQIARGKTLYGVTCTGCHGADLRGGDLGGPNLLRSQLALSDQDGELIVPIIQGSRQEMGMPAIPMSPADGKAVAAFIRSVVATIGTQGRPPEAGRAAPNVLVGDAIAGQAYFAAKCGSCHSITGDLKGIASRILDPKMIQNTWVAGGGGRGRLPSGSVAITLASGGSVEGKLVRIDDFFVTVELADGTIRTITREGEVPKVEIRDPMKGHRDLLPLYTDKDIHDVTAYLVTLK